jgi:hypothetical protein
MDPKEETMRTSLFLAAILIAPVAFAQETTPAQGGAGDPEAQVVVPLHRHPTLFRMLRRSNEIRRGVGLFGHRMNPALTKAAQDHANYMAQTGQFSHYVNGGHQYRASKYGFRGGVRENIAMGTGSVEGAFGMWHASGGHYASIVSGTTEAGFGYAVSPSGTPYWVGVYGSPAQGDEIGETEDEVAKALEEEKKKEAEKNEAQQQAGEGNASSGNSGESNANSGNGAGNNGDAGNRNAGSNAPAPRVQGPTMM